MAADLIEEFADGVFFVNLATLSDPALVVSSISQALGVREAEERPLRDELKEYLREGQLLLVLDNFEQVVEAAPQVAELLATCPRLKALVTSRVRLRLREEREFPVSSLALPDRRRLPERSALSQYAAVALFIERAQAIRADFTVTNENAPAVAEICWRLDGLPLAIELAAARIKLFSPQALLTRLENRLRLLTDGARDLPARQQTLRSAIAWSYALLKEAEQRLFRRLAVFVGGFTLEAMEEVCSGTLDVLASLVDQSLLRQEDGLGDEPRFSMLETIREFAGEELVASGETEAIRQQHAAWHLRLAEAAEKEMRGPQQMTWLDRLEAEHDNLRAVLTWALDRGEVKIGLPLATALEPFWDLRGYWAEARERLTQFLALTAAVAPEVRAHGLSAVGHMAFRQGDFSTARTAWEECRVIFQHLGDRRGIAGSLHNLGRVMRRQGDPGTARRLLEKALAIAREGVIHGR